MNDVWRKLTWLALVSMLGMNVSYGETITATCYAPKGKRIDVVSGAHKADDDGYSNSNPTFFYTSKDPKVLIESWQAALPFPDLITRERVDEIVPPSVTKAVVVSKTDSVIHALSITRTESSSTTLYIKENAGIFTRVRVKSGLSGPMGAVYSARCNIAVRD